MVVTRNNNIALLGIAVLFIYSIISFWINEYWYIRLGMGLTSIFIAYSMFRMRFNKIAMLIIMSLLVYSIIFYHEVRAFLIQ